MVKAYIFKQCTNIWKIRPFSILCFKSGQFMKTAFLSLLLDILENHKKKKTLCLFRKALIGSHPSSASRTHFGMFILVRIVILAAWYWRLSNKSFYAVDEGNHIELLCGVVRAVKGSWCLRVRAGGLESKAPQKLENSMVILQNCYVTVSHLSIDCFSVPDQKKTFQGLIYFQRTRNAFLS